jgi:hypothetical protein
VGLEPPENRRGAREVLEAVGGRVDQGRDDAEVEMRDFEGRDD